MCTGVDIKCIRYVSFAALTKSVGKYIQMVGRGTRLDIKASGKKSCENKHIADKILYQAFISTFNALIENKDYFIEKWCAKKNDENVLVRYKAQQLIEIIKETEILEEFDTDIYFKIIEKMIVFEGNKIIVTLLDGTEMEVVIE